MTWNAISPDGTKSVKSNNAILQANTTYIATTVNADHFWADDVTRDGHHKFVQTRATNDADSSLPTNTALATGMDLVYYSRFKTSAESTVQQDVQPFVKNVTGDATPWASGVMQLLGIRAMAVFDVSGAGVLSTKYSHNCTVARTGAGRFTASFPSNLPSVNYCFLGSAVANDTDTGTQMNCSVESNTDLSMVKKIDLVKFRTVLSAGSSTITRTVTDPLQAYFVVFGG